MTQYIYTSDTVILDYYPGNYSPEQIITYNADRKFWSLSVDEVKNRILTIYDTFRKATTIYDPDSWTTVFCNSDFPTTITADDIDIFNYDASYPIIRVILKEDYLVSGVPATTYDIATIFAVPVDYDFTVIPPTVTPPPNFDAEDLVVTPTKYVYYPSFDSDLVIDGLDSYFSAYTAIPNFYLIASFGVDVTPTVKEIFQLTQNSNKLWMPNDGEPYPLKYTDGVSIVNVVFGADKDRYGQIHPAKDGGFMLYETATLGGTPINNAFIFRNDRTLSLIIPVNQIGYYLP